MQVTTGRWSEFRALAPDDVRPYLLDFEFDEELLFRLNVLQERVHVSEIAWWLDQPVWTHDDVPFSLRPRQVMHAPRLYPEHARRIATADLDDPVYVTALSGRTVVLDGSHRLAKATAYGLPTILVKRVPASLYDRIRVV